MFDHYYSQYCLKRPKFILIFILASCSILLLYQYQFSSTVELTENEFNLHDRPPRRAGKVVTMDARTSYKLIGSEVSENSLQVNELLQRIDDLKRIKSSVIDELKGIQREKTKLLKEKTFLISRIERLNQQIGKGKSILKQIELDVSSNRKRKFEHDCDIERWTPVVFNPLESEFINSSNLHLSLVPSKPYTIQQNFDISLCPITKDFRFYVFSPNVELAINDRKPKVDPYLVYELLKSHEQFTNDPDEACLCISLNSLDIRRASLNKARNYLLLDLLGGENLNLPFNVSKASFVFRSNSFRNKIDLTLPSIWQLPQDYDTIVGSMPPQSPLNRKYLASYFGERKVSDDQRKQKSAANHPTNSLEEVLQVIHRNSIDDLFLFIYDCDEELNTQCLNEREKLIELSTFLIIIPQNNAVLEEYTSDRIYLSLSRGTIPVIIGKERIRLPFDEVIDWRRAALLLPTGRLPEIHFIMRSISAADLYKLKYHGRRIFEKYFATAKQILDTTISIMSIERFNYPPPPIQQVKTAFHNNNRDLLIDYNCSTSYCLESRLDTANTLVTSELYGPRDIPFPSQSYRRNLSLVLSSTYDLWNQQMYSPFHLYPNLPIDSIPPAEYKFFSTNNGYRPIADGLGGSGDEFSRAIGGDYPTEQFTIVLLTYERESILMKTLERLKGLAYLNKVLVIWNGVNQEPSEDIVWPDIGAPIKLIKVNRNSLNNRFLPYDAIETDAILSLDDDSPLRPDEIVFAFRVWRQSRDRIVGFPGRFHAWDKMQSSWLYNSNHSCELSMVLTGGAFFHKYYTYIYSYTMPKVIRSIVDKFMNCEDIAMNFLVAHLTRKPPIKVTSRWTFHCPTCASSLSEDDSHFRERHECLNTFASIYGYMPLLNTQQRSDSVLFKTRLPHDKQKCYRFV